MTTEERFWRKVNKTDTCWLWTSAQNGHGYGIFWLSWRAVRAHRLGRIRWLEVDTGEPMPGPSPITAFVLRGKTKEEGK